MSTAKVTVAFVNPPKPGRKQGSIKTEDGVYIGVWPEMLGQFAKGGTYEIEYDSQTGKDGRVYHSLKKLVSGSNGAQAPLNPSAGGGQSHAKAAEMFAMGMLNRSVQGLGVEAIPEEDVIFNKIVALRAAWTAAWAAPLGPQTKQVPLSQELNDDIPF